MKRYMLYINGPDQVGIVTAVTQSLTRLRCNLEDSRMTILRGQLSIMMTIAVGVIPQEVVESVLSANMQPNAEKHTFLASDGPSRGAESLSESLPDTKQIIEYALKAPVNNLGLHAFLVELKADLADESNIDVRSDFIGSSGGRNCLFVSVHGIDQIGIVSNLAAKITKTNSSIVDLATRLAGNVYVLVMTVELAEGLEVDVVTRELTEVADGLGVTCKISSADPDLL